MADIPGDTSTTSVLAVGSTITGTLETLGDHDWYRITLSAGQSISVSLNGITFADTYLYIRNSAGTLIYSNDDISSANQNSQVAFTATSSGTYYIDVGAWNEAATGTYQVSVETYTPPPVATNDQIADQLVSGYWGGDSHHFNVTQGGTITVNISTLTAGEQTLARAALAEWTDIIGVHFREVTTGAQISFDNTEETAGTPIAATDAELRPRDYNLCPRPHFELMGRSTTGPASTATASRPMFTRSATRSGSAMPAITTDSRLSVRRAVPE